MARLKVTMKQLEEEIGNYIYELLEWKVKKSIYSSFVYEEILRNKRRLRNALRECIWKPEAKAYVKSIIEEVLHKKFSMDGYLVEQLLPFETGQETGRDMLEYLLLLYKRDHGNKAFLRILAEPELKPEDGQITLKQISGFLTGNAILAWSLRKRWNF